MVRRGCDHGLVLRDTAGVPLRIRPARPDEFARLLEIWRDAVEQSHAFLTPADIDWYQDSVASYLPRMNDLRVAVDDAKDLVGFIAQDGGEVHMLFVLPSAQGLGVGTALLEDVASGFDVVRLDVNEQNPSARAFYSAKGFHEVGRSEVDGQGRPFPLLHLRRDRVPTRCRASMRSSGPQESLTSVARIRPPRTGAGAPPLQQREGGSLSWRSGQG